MLPFGRLPRGDSCVARRAVRVWAQFCRFLRDRTFNIGRVRALFASVHKSRKVARDRANLVVSTHRCVDETQRDTRRTLEGKR